MCNNFFFISLLCFAVAVKESLLFFKDATGRTELSAIDFMDDGSPIKLHILIDEHKVISSAFFNR